MLLTDLAIPITIFMSTLISVGTLTWLAAGQFSAVRSLVYSQTEKIVEKLEYHERHDDKRFQMMADDVWAIKVRNAAKDTVMDELIKLKDTTSAQKKKD